MIPSTDRVLMLERFGGPEGFSVVLEPMPKPGKGEVLVKVLAASVQFTDVILRKGEYPDLKEKPPLVLGYDLVGEVVKLGPGVTSPALGQHVADLTMTGSYAQYRALDAASVAVVDPALDPAEATSLVLSWVTAYQLLHRDARVHEGQKVLVLGAAGAVGEALVVLGKRAGCEVWGAAHGRHAARIRELGATFVDSDAADFAVARADGFDAVFDGIGEQGFSRSFRAVGPDGHLSAYGFSDGVRAGVSVLRLGLWFAKLWLLNAFSTRSASFFSITSARRKHPEWFVADLGVLLGMLGRGEVKPRIAERIGLEGVAGAHARLERGGVEGKIILVPNG